MGLVFTGVTGAGVRRPGRGSGETGLQACTGQTGDRPRGLCRESDPRSTHCGLCARKHTLLHILALVTKFQV